jgi:hypothetical protein
MRTNKQEPTDNNNSAMAAPATLTYETAAQQFDASFQIALQHHCATSGFSDAAYAIHDSEFKKTGLATGNVGGVPAGFKVDLTRQDNDTAHINVTFWTEQPNDASDAEA